MDLLSIKKLLKKYCTRIFPQICVLCDMPCDQDMAFCHICQEDLPLIAYGCQKCGAALAHSAHICGSCLQEPIATGVTVIPFHYQPPIDFLITQLKFNAQLRIVEVMAKLLEQYLKEVYPVTSIWPEVIIPMPLHVKRLSERGFNQALEITKVLSRLCNVPYRDDWCQRHKHTEAQANLNAKLRKSNVQNAFSVTTLSAYQHVAILDDVLTTGYTMRVLTKTLVKAGVRRIDVWAIARA